MMFTLLRNWRKANEHRAAVKAEIAELDQMDAATRMIQDGAMAMKPECYLSVFRAIIKDDPLQQAKFLHPFANAVSQKADALEREGV